MRWQSVRVRIWLDNEFMTKIRETLGQHIGMFRLKTFINMFRKNAPYFHAHFATLFFSDFCVLSSQVAPRNWCFTGEHLDPFLLFGCQVSRLESEFQTRNPIQIQSCEKACHFALGWASQGCCNLRRECECDGVDDSCCRVFLPFWPQNGAEPSFMPSSFLLSSVLSVLTCGQSILTWVTRESVFLRAVKRDGFTLR